VLNCAEVCNFNVNFTSTLLTVVYTYCVQPRFVQRKTTGVESALRFFTLRFNCTCTCTYLLVG